ncbi:hypothetical protein ACFSCW_05300 [Sphingomonas tabacisoli]|uniref:Uncharacterized protein n=1 Tax=Sphingomonas tabacisoli TaxID=2249466 RepID=A0ABW4I0S5_9SPHN
MSSTVAAAPPTTQDQAAKDLVDSTDALVDETEAKMSPAEKRDFDRKVEASANAEMQAKAQKCGTELTFTTEPKIEERHVYVKAGATPEQMACIRAELPFVQADPNH